MPEKDIQFQQGRILHDAVIGAFKANGLGFEAWCAERGYSPSLVRNATYGQSGGPRGKAILEEVIDAAGRDFVRQVYIARLKAHVAQLQKGRRDD